MKSGYSILVDIIESTMIFGAVYAVGRKTFVFASIDDHWEECRCLLRTRALELRPGTGHFSEYAMAWMRNRGASSFQMEVAAGFGFEIRF
jgi:hypothetical protein